VEVIDSLKATLEELVTSGAMTSFEDILTISFQPLSVFRVRPVTRCIETMPGHTDAVLHVLYSPNGKHLASGGGDKSVRFWNISSSLPMHTCLGHRNHILAMVSE
jgi:ribosome assembly protein 4